MLRARALRAFGDHPVEIVLDLPDLPAPTRDALDLRSGVMSRAAREASDATRAAVRALLVETPFLSLRDAAEVLGISHQAVQEAAQPPRRRTR